MLAIVIAAILLVVAGYIVLSTGIIKPAPTTYGIAVGDLNSDGLLDAFYANGQNEGPQPNTVLLNQGGGKLIDSGQRLGKEESRRVTLADLDGDGDLDAAVVIQESNSRGYHLEIWLNDGQGSFTKSSQTFAHSRTQAFALGDLNGDGRLDILAGWFPDGYAIWWNQDGGKFTH